MGFEVELVLALTFGLYSVYGSLAIDLNRRWRGDDLPAPESGSWIMDSETLLKGTNLSPEESHKLMLALSTDPARFANNPTQSDRPFDFTHLKTWPIVHLGDTRFCVPILDFLIDRITIRAYFDIIDSLPNKQQKQAFGGFFGKVVERYVHILLSDMLGPPGQHLGRWFAPEQYERVKGGPEGPDAIIIGHAGSSLAAIFVEVKASRPSRDVVVSGDLTKLAENWHLYLIGTPKERKGARQLDRSIKDFRAGRLSLPGIEQSAIDSIYPVIVTLDPWPFYMEIYESFQQDVASLGLLEQAHTAPIDVWSCFDLELLVPRILAGESLFQLLKQRPSGGDHLPLWLQLNSQGPRISGNAPVLEATWDEIADSAVGVLDLKD